MKPLTTIQAEARAAFPFMAGDVLDTERVKVLQSFLDTQLSLAHAAGKEEGRSLELKASHDIVQILKKGQKGAYVEALEDFEASLTEEKN